MERIIRLEWWKSLLLMPEADQSIRSIRAKKRVFCHPDGLNLIAIPQAEHAEQAHLFYTTQE
jgi:hypothetical protein